MEFARQRGARVIAAAPKGVGAASTAGLLSTSAEIVCIMDCDATVNPQDLPQLVQPLLDGRADLVVGSRTIPPGALPGHVRVLLRWEGWLIRRRWRVRVTDLGSARAVRRSKFARSAWVGLNQRNGWSVDVLRLALISSASVEEVPLLHHPRLGRSKVSGTAKGFVLTIFDTVKVLARSAKS